MHRTPATFQVDGAAIRTRRMALGMSLAECAAKAGITKPYLIQLELGRRLRMRPPTYKRLRTALDVPTNDRQLLAPPEGLPRREEDARHEGAPRPDGDG